MPKKTKINIEENEVKEVPANPKTPRNNTPEDKVKKSMKEVQSNTCPIIKLDKRSITGIENLKKEYLKIKEKIYNEIMNEINKELNKQ